ncbi:MAG TPA: glycosyltransferase family 9 protein, partial [Puia sp.]|nr:glycosyltransferase family 9 protein [Puia sp.]
AFIGDVVLATALIEKLHAYYPDAQIDFLVRKGNEALLTGHPYLNEVLIWDKKQNKLKNLFLLLGRIRKRRYDKLINIQRFAATGLLTAFSGAKETIGFDKNPLSRLFTHRIPHLIGDKHETFRNQTLIAAFTDDMPTNPRLYPTKADEEKVKPYKTKPYITISPASVWFTKQYPREKWAGFMQKLPAGITVYLLGAPADRELCQGLFAGNPSPLVVDLSGQLSFLQSTALMRDARMNYVNDSAPMHFASAVNAPVTAVYCSTIPAFGFGPLSDNRHIVEIQEPLDCRPCGLHGYKACPRGHFNCAYKIQDQQLLETLPGGSPVAGL